MNYTTDFPGAPLLRDNNTELPNEVTFDMDNLLENLRSLHIKEFYGEHYQLIFAATCVVCIIGYVTNTLNIIVFSRTSLANSMNLFLFLLAVSDIILISTAFAHIIHYYSGYTLYPFYGYYIFFMICTFFESVFDNVSNWFVATVAIWRYVAITWPQRCSRWFRMERVNIMIMLIVVFSIFLAFPMFLFLTYETHNFRGKVFYDKTFSEFAKMNNHSPLKVYWGFLLLRGLIPMIIMAISTGGLIVSLCKNSRGTEKDSASYKINLKITVMLIVLMMLFLLSNLPDSFMMLITVISGGDSELQESYRHATDVIRVFMLANNSFSFFIYYGLGYEFRTEFNKLFCRKLETKNEEDSVAESTVGNVELDSPGTGTKNTSNPMKTIPSN